MTDTQDLIVRLREGLNGWLKSPMLTKAADALEAAQAEIERLEKLSVTNIMLAVVPGDGSGLEVYAQSVADVEQKLGDIGSELEDWQLGIKHYPAFQEIVDQRAAALARLAEIEAQESVATVLLHEGEKIIDGTMAFMDTAWLGMPLFASAGASPAEPNFCESCAMDLSTCDCVTPRPVFVNQLPSAQPSESAEHWHSLYIKKCQELHDEKARLGAEIETLELAAIDDAERYAVPPSQALSLDLLERLSKTLTRLGYATPEGGMEHFNADLANQLYSLCRAVDSLFDREQPPAPSEAAITYMTGYSDGREWAGATSQAQPSQAVELSDGEVMRCISESACYGTVRMSFESGPYSIDKPSLNATKFARAIIAAINAKGATS